MALPLTLPPNGYLRLSYSGPVNAAGSPAQQRWSLSAIPRDIRASAGFDRSILILARPLSSGLVDVDPGVAIVKDAEGIPEEIALNITAGALTDEIALDVWCLHSIIGAISDSSKAYFIQNPGVTADVTSVFGRTGAVNAASGDYDASQVDNDSGVTGLTVSAALDALAAAIAALSSDDIDNDSGVAGLTVTAALDALAAAIAALTSDDIANSSTVAGLTVTAALDALAATITALSSDDIANDSVVPGATVTAALDALAALGAALSSDDIANDSGVAGATVTAALDALSASIAALSSDDIANDSTVAGATVTAALDTLDAESGGPSLIFAGGASMTSGDTGRHFEAQEGINGNKTVALDSSNQVTAPFAGALDWLAWSSATADATTVFKVIINGLVAETLTLTGASGVLALSAAIAQGDLVAVEYDSGTAPGATTVQVYAS